MDQVARFRQSLAETIAWCTAWATLADPEHCLRTPALQPSPLEYMQSLAERRACVATVIDARSQLLRDAGLEPQAPATNLAGGRLVLYMPDGTINDGGAAVYSRRFYDDDDIPPWDCWVLYVSDPLAPEERLAEKARGRRSGRWSSVPPTLGEDLVMRGDAPPYYEVEPAWSDSYLVSWVAPPLIPLAHTGLIGNPISCLEWLADRNTPFTRALQEVRLLV